MTGLALVHDEALATTEVARLAECERAIDKGLHTFIEVGRALMEIRDQRLYRAGYKSFEAYCAERWGLARTSAYKKIRAQEVARHLADDPPHYKAAVALIPLASDPDRLRKVWRRLRADGVAVTAEDATEAVADTLGGRHGAYEKRRIAENKKRSQRRQRAAAALRREEAANRAREVGGPVAEVFSLVHKMKRPIDQIERPDAIEAKRALDRAYRAFHELEDALGAAIRAGMR